jgi:acyl-CoA thioester hydrolase
MKHVIVSHRHENIAADGDGVVVMYDYNEGRKTAIPDEIRLGIQKIEQR